MFDRVGIYERFADCYSATYAELAVILGIARQTTHNWLVGRYPIPWIRLKTAIDEKGISWDWLINGKEPKYRQHRKNETPRPMERHAINQRFLSLFPDMSQAKIAKELGVNQTTVFKWRHDMSQIPWEHLKYAVDNRNVTWEWLIEGR